MDNHRDNCEVIITNDVMELDEDFWNYPDYIDGENDFLNFLFNSEEEEKCNSIYQLMGYNLHCYEKL